MTTPNDPITLSHWIAAGAAVIQTGATVVLVWITSRYVRLTRDIAEAAKRQGEAAQQSARLQSNQWEADRKMSAAALDGAVLTTLQGIRFLRAWEGVGVDLANPGIPSPELLPSNADDVVRFAGRISQEAYTKVSRAFVALKRAKYLLELARIFRKSWASENVQVFTENLRRNLDDAQRDLEEVERMLKEPPKE